MTNTIRLGLVVLIAVTSTAALAQSGAPSGPAVTGDPAASSVNPRSASTTGAAIGTPGGSGTSFSGGRDDN